MKPRAVLVCLLAALAVLLWHWVKRAPILPIAVSPAPAVALVSAPSPVVPPSTIQPVPGGRWSRAEVAAHLLRAFSKEQLSFELELERSRYRGQYWQAEPGLAELQSIETRRAEGLRQLTAEMNAMLAEMSPHEPGAPLTLTPLFSVDHPAPNLAFLSEASREKMAAALLARDSSEDDDPLQSAKAILSDVELADYLRWNAPPAAALRNRLAGFEASEDEFNAILAWQAAAGSDRESEARAELAQRLGSDRLAQLDQQNDPALHTATQDLRRLGLPLADAQWLADFRQRAAAHLQQSWTDPKLPDGQKQEEVAALQNAFRAELAGHLKTRGDTGALLP